LRGSYCAPQHRSHSFGRPELAIQPARQHRPADLIRYGKIRWRIEHDHRELKTGLGLYHFEGYSFMAGAATSPSSPGAPVHHHTATRPKSGCAGLTLYKVIRELQLLLATWTGACPTCGQPVEALRHNKRGPT